MSSTEKTAPCPQAGQAPNQVEHPFWCYRAWCTVTDDRTSGDHIRITSAILQSAFGPRVVVGVVAEHFHRPIPDSLAVLVMIEHDDPAPSHGEVNWGGATHLQLEPEEARLLARRLIEGADEWEQVRGGRGRATSECPTWCQTDHPREQAQRVAEAAAMERYLAENREQMDAVMGGPQKSATGPLQPETCLVHRCEVGSVLVAIGDDGDTAPLTVVVERIEDVDGSFTSGPARVLTVEPRGWSEDYTSQQALELSALVARAAALADV